MVIGHFHFREFDAGGRSSGFVVDLRREMLNSRRSHIRQTAVKSSWICLRWWRGACSAPRTSELAGAKHAANLAQAMARLYKTSLPATKFPILYLTASIKEDEHAVLSCYISASIRLALI